MPPPARVKYRYVNYNCKVLHLFLSFNLCTSMPNTTLKNSFMMVNKTRWSIIIFVPAILYSCSNDTGDKYLWFITRCTSPNCLICMAMHQQMPVMDLKFQNSWAHDNNEWYGRRFSDIEINIMWLYYESL